MDILKGKKCHKSLTEAFSLRSLWEKKGKLSSKKQTKRKSKGERPWDKHKIENISRIWFFENR